MPLQLRQVRADLAIMDKTVEQFLATKLLLAAGGAIFGPFMFLALWEFGLQLNVAVPVWLALHGVQSGTTTLPDLPIPPR